MLSSLDWRLELTESIFETVAFVGSVKRRLSSFACANDTLQRTIKRPERRRIFTAEKYKNQAASATGKSANMIPAFEDFGRSKWSCDLIVSNEFED